MSYRAELIATGEYYHVMNRGVEKRSTFIDERDNQRFIEMIAYYYRSQPPTSYSQRSRIQLRKLEIHNWGHPLVEMVAYCLMPNHFHFLIKPVIDGGLATFMARLTNAYTRAFNTRYKRVGALFQGAYKAVHIESNTQLLHVCRYIHLNPIVANLVKEPAEFRWSSHKFFASGKSSLVPIDQSIILEQFSERADFAAFVNDHVDYAKTIHAYKKLLIDED